MELHIEHLKASRDNILKIANNYTSEQLNQIPEGFSNNLIWNMGHVLVTQQLLTYNLSGLATKVSAEMINKYRKGTRPEGRINQSEIDFIKSMLLEMIPAFEEDYSAGRFREFKAYTTSYGISINNIHQAAVFNNMHEALHLGNMIAIRKFL